MLSPSSKERRSASRRLVKEAWKLEAQIPAPKRRGGPVMKRCPSGEPAWKVRRKMLATYGRAIRLDPESAETYVSRATYFRRQCAAAQDDMRQALALKPRKPGLYCLMATPFENAEKRDILQRGLALCREDDPDRHRLQSQHDRIYWYAGDFATFVAAQDAEAGRLEKLIAAESKSDGDGMSGSLHTCCGFLEMGHSALGRYGEAEQSVRRVLPYLDRIPDWHDAPTRSAEDIILIRMHANDFAGALAACAEFGEVLLPERRELWEALLHCLCDGTAPGVELVHRAEADRHPPGARDFLLGVFYSSLGRPREATRHLNRLIEWTGSNPTEWGVTFRWEVVQARKLLEDKPTA